MTTIEQLNEQLTTLTATTHQLQKLLSDNSTAQDFINPLESIKTTAANISAIGPLESHEKIPGMYETWSELVLALVATKDQQLAAPEATTLEQAIHAVRTLRRKFNLAPGGA